MDSTSGGTPPSGSIRGAAFSGPVAKHYLVSSDDQGRFSPTRIFTKYRMQISLQVLDRHGTHGSGAVGADAEEEV